MLVTYPTIATTEAVFVKTSVNFGIAKRRKYAMCSANGWITAAKEEQRKYGQINKKETQVPKINLIARS